MGSCATTAYVIVASSQTCSAHDQVIVGAYFRAQRKRDNPATTYPLGDPDMSQQSRQPKSGLRSIKRDFSAASLPSLTQDSALTESDATAIPWTPTPTQKVTGLEQRLRDIQDALDGQSVSSEKILTNGRASILQKRPSSSQNPPTKRRQLPSSWNEEDPTLQSSYFSTAPLRQSGLSRTSKNSTTLHVPASPASNGSKSGAIDLSEEQKHILSLVLDGHSLFYTGSAGTGKSVLLREIITKLKQRYSTSPDAVAVTASTGIAACNIGGVTIHSFAGIGLGRENAEQLTTKVKKNKKASARWLRTKVLIIDEVSMVEGELFDKLARVGSLMRKRIEPFGGIQVIVTGDFFQLPPVTKGGSVKFAFEAELWSQTIKKTFNLTQVFRQKDPEFVDMLNEMRFGRLTKKSIDKFHNLSREIIYEDGLGATELFPRREDVEKSNAMRMNSINTEVHTYRSSDGGSLTDPAQREKLLNNFIAPERLVLKVGAQVMLIKNVDDTLVNGSMGKVAKFVDPADPPSTWLDGDDPGLLGTKYSYKPPSKVGKDAAKMGSKTLWPLVDFLQPGGGTRLVPIQPETWKVELPNGEVQVSRIQLPLILAWAMSIHKSQGQTLERVKVDLARVFEKGQAYVALSRATSLSGLQVLNFNPAKVWCYTSSLADSVGHVR
ncbi:hypothetical protein AcV5_010527 [Taiwanofungus camphoratus]|nr:hypothetical protein AcV5_010527 [Antrodia cinnamomea]